MNEQLPKNKKNSEEEVAEDVLKASSNEGTPAEWRDKLRKLIMDAHE